MNKKIILSIIISILFLSVPLFSQEDDFVLSELNLYIGESYDIEKLLGKFIEDDYANLIIQKDPLSYYFEINDGKIEPKFVGDGIIIINKKDDINYTKIIKLNTRSKIKQVILSKDKITGNSGDVINLPLEIVLYDDVDSYMNSDLRIVSQDSKIASVIDNNRLSLGISGSTVIDISTRDKSINESIIVTSKAIAKNVKILDKELDKKLMIGQMQKLKALINGENNPNLIEWKSSNPSVVSVDDEGNVKAISKGKSTISAVSSDGREKDDYEMSVFTNISGISVDKTSVVLSKIGDKHTIKAEIRYRDNEVETLIDGYYFTSSKPEIISVNQNGVLTALAQGSARVTVRTNDKSALAYVDVYITLTENSDPLEPTVQIRTLKLIDKPTSIIVGELLTLSVEYWPTNATELKLDYSVKHSDIGELIKEDDVYYYRAKKIGMNQIVIEASSGVKTALNINAKSYLGSVSFNTENLNKSSGKNHKIYVGDSIDLSYDFKVKSGLSNKVVYNTGVDYISVASNLSVDKKNNTLKALREGLGKVYIKSIDGGFTDTLYLDVVSAFESIETTLEDSYNVGDKVVIESIGDFKEEDSKDIILTTKTQLHRKYLNTEYVKNEIKYEEKLIKYFTFDKSVNESIRRSILSESKERLDTLNEIIKLSDGKYCELLKSTRLENRNGDLIKVIEIHNDEIKFLQEGKVILVTSEVGSRINKINEIEIK